MINSIIVEFAEQNVNAKLYKDIKNYDDWVALVPTSAQTGDGLSELLLLLTQYTQKKMNQTIVYQDKFEATILEVTLMVSVGTILDVILINEV